MNRTMLVTGASRGIGAGVARLAGSRGYAVAINYKEDAAGAKAVVDEIITSGGRACAIRADVSLPSEVEALFAEIDREWGGVDVLINNAGIIGAIMPIEDITGAALRATFETNVYSSFYCASAAVRRMSTRHGGKGGAIVNMSSTAARHGKLPNELAYVASKGAIESLTIGLAVELSGCSVRVNAVRPGMIATSIHDAHGGDARLRAMAPKIPLRRAGLVDDVANAVLWLASDEADYVHGAILEVSGGR